MKLKNKLLIFLGIFIFMIIPKNVFAREIYPFYISINNTTFTDVSLSYNGRISQSLDANASIALNIDIRSFDDPQYNQDYSFTMYPYTFIYFKTLNTPQEIGITKLNSCNNSCFAYDGIILKQVGKDAISGHYSYILVLKNKKWQSDCGVGSGQCVYKLEDVVTITNTRNSTRGFIFYNVFLSDSTDILNNSNIDIESMISNATTNTQGIINSQNTNTQNIINNQDTNTQDIINNQNTNQQQAHSDAQNTQNAINGVNNSLNDENGVSNNDVSNNTSEWSNKLAGTGPVSQMVLMPINFINAFTTGFGSACTPYNLGSFFGTNITLPCINLSSYLGGTLWTTIDVIISGLFAYYIGKKFVKVFNDFTNLKDNQVDELYGGGK